MIPRLVRMVFEGVASRVAPVWGKETHELHYWRSVRQREGTMGNRHYERFYTAHFGLALSFYNGKRVMDIGCGPRGSLEWAKGAARRVGLDPLAEQYLKLGADKHEMEYCASPSEKMPFPDASFDVVASFNSIDHVADLEQTILEIKRVCRPGGLLLLLTEVGHKPTPTEPQSFAWEFPRRFEPEFRILKERHYEKRGDGMYNSIDENIPYDHADNTERYGILSVMYERA
ncbi:class I SAM-dependent methyltransferase [Candidatus Poribacteria bacterium]|nr:class I SAM-dependent methyltransferase [Candidatus Poribacteria bacterium]